MTAVLALPQAFYGSVTGTGDYEVLAASDGLEAAHRESIEHYTNLGGTALREEGSPAPVIAFWELEPRGRWAFARTVFLAPGPRGNEYLAHVVVLDEAALVALRGDVLALESLGLMSATKPARGAMLPRLALPVAEAQRLTARPCGAGLAATAADTSFAGAGLDAVVEGLARGRVAVRVATGSEGLALCRAVLSLLPPDDRVSLALCSRLSHPRRVTFRLVAFVDEDAPLVAEEAAVLDPRQARGSPSGGAAAWVSAVDGGAEPLWGLSALSRGERSASLVQRLQAWSHDVGSPGSSPGRAPRDPELMGLVADPRNHGLPSVAAVRADALWQRMREHAQAVLAARPVDAAAPPWLEMEDTAVREAALKGALAQREGDGVATLAAAMLALATPESVHVIHDRLFPGPAAAARFVSALRTSNAVACLDLLSRWLAAWRGRDGARCLQAAAAMAGELADDAAAGAVFVAALERAAPADGEARRAWCLSVVRSACLGAGQVVAAARIAARERLLSALDDDTLTALAAPLAATFPAELVDQVDSAALQARPSFLRALLEACERGMRGREMGGEAWDVLQRPVQWSLSARVAAAAADALHGEQAPDGRNDLAWLVWSCARVVPPVLDPADTRLFATVLERLLAAGCDGCADVAVRALFHFRRFVPAVPISISADVWPAVATRALRDAAEFGPDESYRTATLARIVWLSDAMEKVA
jgi:hypothetical protein